jgi:hypothetical protein
VDRSGKDPADVGRKLAAGRLLCPGMFAAAGRVFPVIHDEDVGVIAGENGRACDGPAGLVPAVVCVVAAWWSVSASAATAARQDATWRGHYRLIWLRTFDRSGTASLTKTWPDLRRDIGGMSFLLQILRSDAAHERHEFPFGRFEVLSRWPDTRTCHLHARMALVSAHWSIGRHPVVRGCPYRRRPRGPRGCEDEGRGRDRDGA